MTRRIAILRPEPGNGATAARLREQGLEPLSIPLFDVRALDWTPPDPATFDGLLFTSANALRHGGAGLASLRALPVLAVGAATASTARAAGFCVAHIGSGDIRSLLAGAPGYSRLLWLAGRDHNVTAHPAIAATLTVYASNARALSPADAARLPGCAALVHSPRAAQTLASEVDRLGISRATIAIVAISAAAAQAAGAGWQSIVIAAAPNDDALIAAARPLAIDP